MTKDEIINYWISSSNKDFRVMGSLYKNGHYAWALFLGHLVLEKFLKTV
jgi:HEPN domain-containing protein